jgi:hypothetical protein
MLSGGLSIDIDADGIAAIARELGATESMVGKAASRALKRTAATIRKRSMKELRTELGLRNNRRLRDRLKLGRVRKSRQGAGSEIKVWFGANDITVSGFKGKPRSIPGGAAFRDRSWPGAFVGKKARGPDTGRPTVFKRKGADAHPLKEQGLDVADVIETFVEDTIFPSVGEIFMHHFRADLRARAIHGIG